jgi:hypothetical protein
MYTGVGEARLRFVHPATARPAWHGIRCRLRIDDRIRVAPHRPGATPKERRMERCTGCQFYDRTRGQGESKAANAGQCRRNAPQLSPINQKSYMIEGVWPTVRDDDWCGEWKALARRNEPARVDPSRVNDLLGTPLSSPLPIGSAPRINAQTARAALGVLGVDTPAVFPGVAANGRGGD